jgi:calcineurin-like phosphoesterase family protein
MKIVLNKKVNVWFSSDFHYGHSSIVKGVSKWENKKGCRNFDTLEEHDEKLIKNINDVVKENDILFFLGDWSFGGFKNNEALHNVFEFRLKIKCKNIHFILGNHDHIIEENKESFNNILPQDLFASVSQYKEVRIIDDTNGDGKALKYNFFLCHYAMRVWNKSHHGAIHLYGHSHNTLDEMTPLIANPNWIGDGYYTKNYRTMDVGVDCHPEFRPFSFHEIKEIMEKRTVELEIDHHE